MALWPDEFVQSTRWETELQPVEAPDLRVRPGAAGPRGTRSISGRRAHSGPLGVHRSTLFDRCERKAFVCGDG